MFVRVLVLAVLVGLTGSARAQRLPAEFEPHAAVWMAWPPAPECMKGHPLVPPTVAVLTALAPHVPVELVVRTPAEILAAQAALAGARVPPGRVRFRVIPDAGFWLRDIGPPFVQGRTGLAVVDFGFNSWGYEGNGATHEQSAAMEALDRHVAAKLGLPVVKTRLTGEGGARETDGQGTMIVVDEVERDRNPGWSHAAIETELARVMGIHRVIWLPRGLVEDRHIFEGPLPGGAYPCVPPGGHTDELVRFADPHTVLLADASPADRARDPVAAEDGRRLDEARRVLSGLYRIVALPLAEHVEDTLEVDDTFAAFHFKDGTRLTARQRIRILPAASYLNFFATNGCVLVPQYARAGGPPRVREKDRRAREILAAAFPGRAVIGLDVDALNHCGGGVHCMVHEQPLTDR